MSATAYSSSSRDYETVEEELEQYKCYYAAAQKVNEELKQQVEELKRRIASLEQEKAASEATLRELEKEYARLKATHELNGSNSGIPTSKTSIHQKKRIPNSRKMSGKKRGGQAGHEKKKLERFEDYEVSENVEHKYESCPFCGGELEGTGTEVTKDETDYDFYVIKRRHHFPECRCKRCGKRVRKSVPHALKEENQYGPHVQAMLLGLTNIGFISANRAKKMMSGFSGGQIVPSEGYIMKLQKRSAKRLETFCEDARRQCLMLPVLHWDDTVIDVDAKRCCLRYYGDEKLAYYTAHEHKDRAGVDADEILPRLSSETVVMHDHNILNYNKAYCFGNAECNAHLLRDLQKTLDHTGHAWAKEMKEHVSAHIHRRNQLLEAGEAGFSDEEVNGFFQEFSRIMVQAVEEISTDIEKPHSSEECALFARLVEYKEAYFAWVTDFEIPVTNNVSERGLRMVKTKMKVSGMFNSISSARDFATIRTYIETCSRNGVNGMQALTALCCGTPVILESLFHPSDTPCGAGYRAGL